MECGWICTCSLFSLLRSDRSLTNVSGAWLRKKILPPDSALISSGSGLLCHALTRKSGFLGSSRTRVSCMAKALLCSSSTMMGSNSCSRTIAFCSTLVFCAALLSLLSLFLFGFGVSSVGCNDGCRWGLVVLGR